MANWKTYLKKEGGFKLLKRYFRTGVLFPAICQFLLLGRSKKALEILRLSVSLKTQQLLARKYGTLISHEIANYNSLLSHEERRTIWIYWHQGLEDAPLVVRRCFESVKENLCDWEIVLLTKNNIDKYAQFPEYIMEKVRDGRISLTHFSDLLRLELLIKYGGLWLDSTVLCTGGNIPNSILNSDLFCYQCLKPGADGHASLMSSWLIWAKSNNRLLTITRNVLFHYWGDYDYMVDYYLLHHFFSIVCNMIPEDQKRIPCFCNSTPHILLLNLFEPYNEVFFRDLCACTCFHKLSYKLDDQQKRGSDTYFDKIIENKLCKQ